MHRHGYHGVPSLGYVAAHPPYGYTYGHQPLYGYPYGRPPTVLHHHSHHHVAAQPVQEVRQVLTTAAPAPRRYLVAGGDRVLSADARLTTLRE